MSEEKQLKEEIRGRRNYQDSVFRLLFSNRENAIELFNALEGTDYGPETEVQFTTLEDVLYQGVKNDLGFVIDNRYIVLTEHQSARSENMPMRQLQYIARTFETIVDSRVLFKSGVVKVPTPEFFVIYTGKEPWDMDELRLSASFLDEPPENSLELVVKIIKVVYNEDEEFKQNEVLRRSEKLQGYGMLLHYIRSGVSEGKELKEAIDLAVNRCLEEGILEDFLKTHSAEVGTRLYDDITREEFLEIRAEEAREEGFAKGLEEGRAVGIEQGIERGIEQGLERGIEQGLARGIEQGLERGIAALIADYLEDGKDKAEIVKRLQKRFELDEERAKAYFADYEGSTQK